MSKSKTSHVGPCDVCLQIFHWSCDIVKDVNMSFSHFSTCRVEVGGGRTPHFQPFKPTLRKSSEDSTGFSMHRKARWSTASSREVYSRIMPHVRKKHMLHKFLVYSHHSL